MATKRKARKLDNTESVIDTARISILPFSVRPSWSLAVAAQKNKIQTIGPQIGARIRTGVGRSAILICLSVGFAIFCRTLPTLAETGTVYQCAPFGGDSFAISPAPQQGSYYQPITI